MGRYTNLSSFLLPSPCFAPIFIVPAPQQDAGFTVLVTYLETGVVVGGEGVGRGVSGQPVAVDGVRPDCAVVDQVVCSQPDARRQ